LKRFLFVIPLITFVALLLFPLPFRLPYVSLLLEGIFIFLFWKFRRPDFVTSLLITSTIIEIGGGIHSFVYFLYIPFAVVSIYTGDFNPIPGFVPLIHLFRGPSLLPVIILYGSVVPFYLLFTTREMRRKKLEEYVKALKQTPMSATDLEKSTIQKTIETGDAGIPMKLYDRYSQAIRELLGNLHNMVRPYSTVLFLRNKEDGLFYLKFGKSEGRVVPDSVIEQGPLLYFMKGTEPLSIDAYSGGSRKLSYYDTDVPIKSLIAFPVIVEDVVEGILCLDSLEGSYFDFAKKTIARSVAMELEILISLYRFTQASMIEAFHFSIIHKLTGEIASKLEREEMFQSVFDALGEAYSDVYPIILLRTSGNFLVIEGDGRRYLKDISESIIQGAIKNNLILIKNNLRAEMKRPLIAKDERDFGAVSILFAPFRGHVDGGILLISDKRNRFNEKDSKVVSLIADVTDTALEKAALYEKEKMRAVMDGLTGVYNHRFFQEFLQKQMEKAEREGEVFSLLMIDIDHFKKFNDRYGHQTGDLVLKEVAMVIRDGLRASDIVARYGGEEFAVVLPNVDRDDAMVVAEKIRKQIEEHNIVQEYGKEVLHVTVSIGVATLTFGMTRDQLISEADRALYRAKGEGRNRVATIQIE